MRVKEAWIKIENWMKINAIETFNSFNIGVKRKEIKKCETELGIKFPMEMKKSLIRHNGQKEYTFGFFDGSHLLTLEEIKENWNGWQRLLKEGTFDNLRPEIDEVDPEIKLVWWNSLWIPIADFEVGDICLDLDPSPCGTLGQIIYVPYQESDRKLIASSFLSLLDEFATDLKDSQYIYSNNYGGLVPFWYEE